MTPPTQRHTFYSILAGVIIISAALIASRGYNQGNIKTLTFDAGPLELVAMSISDTKHYSLSGEGSDDFARLMPTGGHVVHISAPDNPIPQTFTVALFHQLKCLEIYHREYLKPAPRRVTTELRGCLNYIRQSILCHANTRLESVKNVQIQGSKQYETVCRDWTKVYGAAEANFEQYQAWAGRK